ncbi:hypothetical protein [Telluria aromaticivorans]|uniref:DUF4231 domain-containing protein n=1 Tax=Telluria aromaticivorans TaxID=2725995 RepID=A0A7Y2NYU3_9BURK|nr:hypothetical protein [Telluria aromaticivorans]NNG23187.1 hypothetical protein [Telluria aromaticivorans]
MDAVVQREKEPVPDEILKAGEIYYRLGVLIQALLVLLGIIASVASLVVATFSESFTGDDKWMLKAFAFVAALASGLLTTFSLSKKNQETWAAWRMMNAAILRYQYDPSFTRIQLVDTWERAEKTLGNATINEKT